LRDSVRLNIGESVSLPLPNRGADWKGPLFLSFRGRIETTGSQGGSAPALQITVNNVPTSIERLVNKPPYYMVNSEQRNPWYNSGLGAWVLPYYPWDREDLVGGQVHLFVLDLCDLLRPAGNTLTLHNIFAYFRDARLDLQDLRLLGHADFPRLDWDPAKEPLTRSHGMDRFRRKALAYHEGVTARLDTDRGYRTDVGEIAPRDSFAQKFACKQDATGRLTIKVGGETYTTCGYIRAGDGPWRELGTPAAAGQWQSLKLAGDTLTGAAGPLALRRTVTTHPTHIEIRDHLQNRSDADLPVCVVNCLDCGDVKSLAAFRLSGRPQERFWANTSPMTDRQFGTTPLLYLARKNSAMGLVVEDDATRNHGSVMAWDATLAVGDDMLYLGPGGETTLVWKLYPLAERDYFAFLGAVRRDWGLYQRIPALFGFVHSTIEERMYEDVRYRTPETVAAFLKSSGIGVASEGSVVALPDGKNGILYGNEELELLRQGTALFRQWRQWARDGGAPVPCLPYVNVHLCRIVPGKTLADMEQRLPGGLIRDAYGTPVAYRTGWLYCVLPTLDNAVGKHLLDVLKLYVDEQEFAGIYLDEWDHSRARVSFNHEDGVSALLDEAGHIKRKVGLVPILAKPFQLAFSRELQRRNAVVFANQFDDTLDAARLPIVHFAEPGSSHDDDLVYHAQAGRTPLSLNIKASRGIWQDTRDLLRQGVLTCYYWKYLHGDHLLKRCYPITVREIRPGVVIGEDRIVTSASGTFSLGRARPLTAYVYAGPAGQLARTVPGAATVHGDAAVRLELGDDEVAVVME